MSERPKFFDDLAGVAGGAISALAGLRDEAESLVRARTDEAIRRLDLVKREELEAVAQVAANARAGQEAAEAKLAAVMARLDALEARLGPAPAPVSTAPVVPPEAPPTSPASDIPPGSETLDESGAGTKT